MMKRLLYYVWAVFQGIVLFATLFNVTYCFATNSLTSFWITGYDLLFVPFIKVYEGGSYLNIIVFAILSAVSVFLYLKSVTEVFDPTVRKSKFMAVNVLWVMFCMLAAFVTLDNENLFRVQGLYPINIIHMLLPLFVLIFKTIDGDKLIRADRRDGEEFLFEEIQQNKNAKSYKQIMRTAKGAPYLCGFSFLSSLIYWYVDSTSFLYVLLRDSTYLGVAIMVGYYSFACVKETKKFEERTGQPVPSENFVKNIKILHITSLSGLVLSYLLLLMIS